MVKLQLVEDSKPCRVVDSVKCRTWLANSYNATRTVGILRSSRKGRDSLSP